MIAIVPLRHLSVVVCWNGVFVKPFHLEVVSNRPPEVRGILIFFFFRPTPVNQKSRDLEVQGAYLSTIQSGQYRSPGFRRIHTRPDAPEETWNSSEKRTSCQSFGSGRHSSDFLASSTLFSASLLLTKDLVQATQRRQSLCPRALWIVRVETSLSTPASIRRA